MNHPILKKMSSAGLSVFSTMKNGIKEIAEDMDKGQEDNYDYDEEGGNGRKKVYMKKDESFLLPLSNDIDSYEYGNREDQDSIGPEFLTSVIRRPPDFLAERYNRDDPDDAYYIIGFNSPMHIWLLNEIEYMERTRDDDDGPDEEYIPELFFPITESNFEGNIEEIRGFSPIDNEGRVSDEGNNNNNNNNNNSSINESPLGTSINPRYLKLNPEYAEDLLHEYNRNNFKIFAESFTNVMLRNNQVNGIFCNKCEEVVDSIIKGSKATKYGFLDTFQPILLNPSLYIAHSILLKDLIKMGKIDREYYEKRMHELVPELMEAKKD